MHYIMWVSNADKTPLKEQMRIFDEQTEDPDLCKKEIYCKANEYKEFFLRKLKPFWERHILADEDLKEKVPGVYRDAKRQLEKFNKSLGDNEKLRQLIISSEGGQADEQGNLYYYYNPNARYDYYSIGGRWYNWLRTNDGKDCNRAKRKNISLEEMEKRERVEAEQHYDKTRKEFPNDYEKKLNLLEEYPKGITKEEYLEQRGIWVKPYGHLHNGVWLDRDDLTDDEYEKKFDEWWANLDPDTMITVVDCHI